MLFDDAHDPILSSDSRTLAFVRDRQGRGQLMEQSIVPTNSAVALTPPSLNVYEAAFLSEKEYAVSASEHGRPPQIYLTDPTHVNAPLALGETRYPALSAD